MAEPSLQLGNGNWAGKSNNLLAYHKANNNFYADELTFARASTGTIVNSDGLIEEVPYNLASYSEQFDNAAWDEAGVTISANDTTSPDGTTNADKFLETAVNGIHLINNTSPITASATSTASVFYKKGTRRYFSIKILIGSNSYTQVFDSEGLTTGGNSSNGLTNVVTKIEDYGNGWVRASVAGTSASGTSTYIIVGLSNSLNPTFNPTNYNPTYQGSVTDYGYFYGAQINSGSTAKTYFPTTTRLNVPRVDYLNNANGSLLLESQRTNGVVNSNVFTSWFKSGTVTVTANYGVSPTGETNSSLVNFAAASNRLYLSSGLSYANDTISIYVKGVSGETISFGKASSIGTGTLFVLTGEWQRLVIENLSSPGVNIVLGTNSFATAREIEVFGVQDESGTYPTSYIPTSGSTVTRLADTCSTTGLSDVIGQTEGTLFVEISAFSGANTDRQISISDGGTSNRVVMALLYNGTQIQFVVASGGSITVNTTQTIATITSGTKIAFAYKANDFKIYANGLLIASDTSGAVPIGLDTLGFDRGDGNDVFEGNVKNLQLYKTRLSNTELATLTTI